MVERTYYMDNLQEIKNGKDGEHDTVPIIIPTLCRYEHFVRCIESLKENKYARYTDIYISIDYPITEEQREGHDKIVKYVTKISGFRKVIILSQDNNLGQPGHSAQLIRRLKEDGYKRYILTEERNGYGM